MPQIKKPYGLVYNTDGSLCVTYRDDDIPFPGVRSFAVEEATTNYCDDPDPYYGASEPYYGSEEDNVWIEEEGYYGTKCDIQWRDLGHGRYTVQEGDIITCSFEAKLYNGTVNHTISIYTNYGQSAWAELLSRRRINLSTGEVADSATLPNDGAWYRFVFTFVPRTPVTSWKIENNTIDPEAYVLHRKIQFEKRAYSTSFVDGSRPYGKLELENTASIDMTNLVLCGWFKFFDVSTTSLPRRIIEKATGGEGQDGFALIFSNIMDFYIDGTRSTFMSNLEANKWYFIILVFDDGVNMARVYDGETIHETVITKTIPANDKNIHIGCPSWRNAQNILNGLASNFFIGKYRKDNGEIIWTDEYIREVYEAQIPFPVSNKLSIY